MDIEVRFGRDRGKRISECNTADLQWYAKALENSARRNDEDRAEVLAEIARREQAE